MIAAKQAGRLAKQAHRNIAWFLLVFIAVHFATHFASLGGIETHAKAQGAARIFYQFPLIEIALVLAFAAQVLLGIKLLRIISKRARKTFWHRVQFFSGCYLAYFIVAHTGAAIVTRLAIGLETNFYWAAGTLILAPITYVFTPYYLLAVASIFGHLLAALHFRGPRKWHGPALILGPVVGTAFVLGYGGFFYEVALPADYLDYFSIFPGVERQ
jgi:hypothetical protein